jgi:integrase
MPLKLRPPRSGKTPNYEIRGSYLGIAIERSAGTPDKRLAQKRLRDLKRKIERGEFPERSEPEQEAEPTFLKAAVAYLKAGGDGAYLGPIIELTGAHALRDRLISEIDQIAIDEAADALYPNGTPQTKNRQFYTPVSAVLKRAGIERKIKRPKGWRGSKSKWWLEPNQAFALLFAARELDAEFGLLCLILLYTGMRISEALNAKLRHLDLNQEMLYLPKTKNGDDRQVYIPPVVIDAFRAMPPRIVRPNRETATHALVRGEPGRSQIDGGFAFLNRDPDAKLFRFHQGGRLRDLLAESMRRARLSFPRRYRGFHLFCHTYGTWMSRFGKLDNYGLTRTRRWKDPRSAEGYVHTEVNEEARLAAILPTPPVRGKSGEWRHKKTK